jgi:hypothetical protein
VGDCGIASKGKQQSSLWDIARGGDTGDINGAVMPQALPRKPYNLLKSFRTRHHRSSTFTSRDGAVRVTQHVCMAIKI